MEQVNIALLGLGVVGAGTVEVLKSNRENLARRLGRQINIFGVAVKDQSKPRTCDLSDIPFFDAQTLVTHPDVDIVVELIGGEDTAKSLIIQALQANKHCITANKALIAKHGNELFDLAASKDRMIGFEAAVAGGVPIIKSIREGLQGNQVTACKGIINGTCNYILSQMRAKHWTFEYALAQAQALGFAELDPSFDIDGIDTAHKLTILASIAFGIPLQFDKVSIEGIRHISPIDVQYANELGYEIKLLGIAKVVSAGVELRVHPTLIARESMLASVDGAMNAVMVDANAVGPTMYYGQGAGGGPTASAVVADIVETTRMLANPEARVPYLAFHSQADALPVLEPSQHQSAAYLRMMADDKPGVLASTTQILSNHGISIKAMSQKGERSEQKAATVIILTHPSAWGDLLKAKAEIEQVAGVLEPITCLHVEPIEDH